MPFPYDMYQVKVSHNKSQLPLRYPHDALRHAHYVVNKGGHSVDKLVMAISQSQLSKPATVDVPQQNFSYVQSSRQSSRGNYIYLFIHNILGCK